MKCIIIEVYIENKCIVNDSTLEDNIGGIFIREMEI